MKEIKDIHLKVDAVMALFEQVLDSAAHDHFKEFKEEIIEKSKNDVEFLQLNEELISLLVESSIRFLYEDLLSKQKLEHVKNSIFDFIEEETEDPDMVSERSSNIQRLFIKHLNSMTNYADVAIDNLADNIKINIK